MLCCLAKQKVIRLPIKNGGRVSGAPPNPPLLLGVFRSPLIEKPFEMSFNKVTIFRISEILIVKMIVIIIIMSDNSIIGDNHCSKDDDNDNDHDDDYDGDDNDNDDDNDDDDYDHYDDHHGGYDDDYDDNDRDHDHDDYDDIEE